MSGPIQSIAALLDAQDEVRGRYLDLLIPAALRHRFGLADHAPWRSASAGLQRWLPGPRTGTLRVAVWPDLRGEDPAMAMDLADHQFGKLEAAWIVLNRIDGPRYNLDRDAEGRPIALGSEERNVPEELRALADGLAPNQVRPGLGLFRPLLRCLESFARRLGADTLNVVPLAYHNAIQYERCGFTYAAEEPELAEIHVQFLPGGKLYGRLDGSSPFRQPALAGTVRGRSWAIHDGILGQRWVPPAMYKFIERDFQTCTFPGAVW